MQFSNTNVNELLLCSFLPLALYFSMRLVSDKTGIIPVAYINQGNIWNWIMWWNFNGQIIMKDLGEWKIRIFLFSVQRPHCNQMNNHYSVWLLHQIRSILVFLIRNTDTDTSTWFTAIMLIECVQYSDIKYLSSCILKRRCMKH